MRDDIPVTTEQIKQALRIAAQAAIEADRAIRRSEGNIDRYIFTVKTVICGVDLEIDHNGQVKIFKE